MAMLRKTVGSMRQEHDDHDDDDDGRNDDGV